MTAMITIDESRQIKLPEGVKRVVGAKPGARLRAEVTADRIVTVKDVPVVTEPTRSASGWLVLAPTGIAVDVIMAIKAGHEERIPRVARLLKIAICVFFLIGSIVQAESARALRMKAQKGNPEAKANLYAAAAKGEKEAQYELGNLIANDESMFWIRKSAEQGYAPAQTSMGTYYEFGRHGVMVDNAEAVKWYRKASEQNHARGQYSLGFMYERGLGVAKDVREAVRLFRMAAEQDDALGMASLGYAYADGRGVENDDVEAVKWLKKAALKNIPNAQGHLGMKYLEGRGVPKELPQACAWFAVEYANPNNSPDGKKEALQYCNALEAKFTEDQKREATQIARQMQAEITDQMRTDLSKLMAK